MKVSQMDCDANTTEADLEGPDWSHDYEEWWVSDHILNESD